MATLPLILTGDTLGQRHRYLNALVDRAFNSDVNFQEIKSIPEQSPVDRLFKIDLASKLRDVDYVMKNLKDDDMLYVSRALKCRWLLGHEYQNIINPEYLEDNLYPHMITTAVSKMKLWISVHMKDPNRCQQFHKYYCEKNFDMALRFLTHCEVSYILNELPKILEKLDPFYLKVFCEKSPHVAKIFFDSLMTKEKVLLVYLQNTKKYYESLKVVLKADSNIFLDITEKYFLENEFERLSPAATKFIMSNCKDRYTAKTELYAAMLLDINTMAECLSSEECKEVVVKLARSKYLEYWFNYKEVEPLIKRLNKEERAAFKRKIFVEKDIGDVVEEWPYPKPSNPSEIKRTKIFDDDDKPTFLPYDNDDCLDDFIETQCRFEPCRMMARMECCERQIIKEKPRTLLDQLFDEFRFSSFEKTLIELRKKIAAESSSQNRQFMMLVLVSKTGGRAESLATLLELLVRHVNEPSHVRATIVRSLVKRAFVWRLPQDSWDSFVTFAAGLGLDGKPPDVECREGIHAVVLRTLLEKGSLTAEVFTAYKKVFSTLKEYSLTASEKNIVSNQMTELLLKSITNETNTNEQAVIFNFLFQTLDEYKLPMNTKVIVPALSALANTDPSVAQSLVLRLFRDKKARKELFRENFIYVSTDASYLNALRHNTEVLKIEKYVRRVLEKGSQKEKFLRKLAIYFTEAKGLAEVYLATIKQSVAGDPNTKLTRPLAILMMSNNLSDYLKQFNEVGDKNSKRFAAALAENSHLSKPKLHVNALGWQVIGAKAIANHVLVSRITDIDHHLINLLKSPRTLKLAIIISQRVNAEVDTFAAVGKIQPNTALKCAVKYFHRNPDTFKFAVWEIVKPILRDYDFENKSKIHSSKLLWRVSKIPQSLKPDYCITLFAAAKKNSSSKLNFVLSQIHKHAPNVNHEIIEDILSQFLQNEFKVEQVLKHEDNKIEETCSYLKILVKFLLLSKSAEVQSKRMETCLEPLLLTLKSVRESSEKKEIFNKYLNEMLDTLDYKQMFFNEEYVSCLPIFERIITWMHPILPMEEYFPVYVNLHLIMLYFKTTRQCLKQRPDVFKHETKKYEDGIDILGRIFGQYIVKEVDELKSRYFESILDIYWKVLQIYIRSHFIWDPLKNEIITSITKGVVECGKNTTTLLGVYMYQEFLKNDDNTGIKDLNCMFKENDNKEIRFFLDCDVGRF